MITIEFEQVGRRKESWKTSVSRLTEANILREARNRANLMSSELEIDYNPSTGAGRIIAGDRVVGSFRLDVPATPLDPEQAASLAARVFAGEQLASFARLPFRDQLVAIATLAHIGGDWTTCLVMLAAIRALPSPEQAAAVGE